MSELGLLGRRLLSLEPNLGSCTRYYAFTTAAQRKGRACFVFAGWHTTLLWLGGSWSGRGQAPRGFPDLEAAINCVLSRCDKTAGSVETRGPTEDAA